MESGSRTRSSHCLSTTRVVSESRGEEIESVPEWNDERARKCQDAAKCCPICFEEDSKAVWLLPCSHRVCRPWSPSSTLARRTRTVMVALALDSLRKAGVGVRQHASGLLATTPSEWGEPGSLLVRERGAPGRDRGDRSKRTPARTGRDRGDRSQRTHTERERAGSRAPTHAAVRTKQSAGSGNHS